MDFFKSAVASAMAKGPLASYIVGERVELDNSIWTLNNGTRRESGANCSILTFDIASNRNRLPIAKNALRRFRTLRLPGVAQVIETVETDTQLYIVTERITPLSSHIQHEELQQETARWGLYNVVKTLKFINDEAALVHSMVRASSIFISESGEWKLAGFELLSSAKDEHDNVIYSYSSLVPGQSTYLPPEVAKSSWDLYRSTPWSAVDAYGVGVLISEVFNGSTLQHGQAPEVGRVPLNMQQIFKRLVSPNPKLRPSVGVFLEQGRRNGGCFQTSLINFSESIDSLGLKSEGEREEFLSQLQDIKDDFPAEYAKRKILPELLKSVEFGGGGPKVLAVVLQIGSKLSDVEYDAQLTPVLVRLFSSPDRALRVYLLDSLSIMIDHLPQKIVNDKIFPNLVTGFTDIAPLVREQTVKSVLVLITKLSERTVNGDLLKYLAKTANDAEPGIRTNTTVCLGKIAKYLGPSTRSKVLVAAFTRSLRDPFVHARHAALMAMAATVDMFSEDDCASKVLPTICPSLVDKEKLVRDQANKTLDVYVKRVRQFAEGLPVSVLPPAAPSQPTGVQLEGAQSAASATDAGWAGWAISSFTNRLAAANGVIEPTANGGPVTLSSTSSPQNSRPSTATPNSRNDPAATAIPSQLKPLTVRQTTETTRIAQSFSAPEMTADKSWDNGFDDEMTSVDEAWGAMDDDGDTFFDASTKAKAQTTATTATAPTTNYDDKGEPDFAGWLKAKQGQTSMKKGPLPKGLGGASKPAPRTTPLSSRAAKPTVKAGPAMKATTSATSKAPEEDEAWGDAWD